METQVFVLARLDSNISKWQEKFHFRESGEPKSQKYITYTIDQ